MVYKTEDMVYYFIIDLLYMTLLLTVPITKYT